MECLDSNQTLVNMGSNFSFANTPRSVWAETQRQRRALMGGKKESRRYMALEPTCGNWFCIEPAHMVEVAYSPAMIAATVSPRVKTVENGVRDGWDACYDPGDGASREFALKKVCKNSAERKAKYVRTCGNENCANPNHWELRARRVVDAKGVEHFVVDSTRFSNVVMSDIYGFLARKEAERTGRGDARIVEAVPTCDVRGCVRCWKVTKQWKCLNMGVCDFTEGWPWDGVGGLHDGGYGQGDLGHGAPPMEMVVQSAENGESSSLTGTALYQFNKKAASLVHEARKKDSCALWTGASVGGYPFISGKASAHRTVIALDAGVDMKDVKHVRNTCNHRNCIRPEHWAGWKKNTMSDAELVETIRKDEKLRALLAKSGIRID